MKAFHTSNRAPRNCWRVRLMWNNPVLRVPRERGRLYRGVHISWSSLPIRGATAYAPGFGVSAGTHGLADALVCTDAAWRDDACLDAAGRLSLLQKPTWFEFKVSRVPIKKKIRFGVPTKVSHLESPRFHVGSARFHVGS